MIVVVSFALIGSMVYDTLQIQSPQTQSFQPITQNEIITINDVGVEETTQTPQTTNTILQEQRFEFQRCVY